MDGLHRFFLGKVGQLLVHDDILEGGLLFCKTGESCFVGFVRGQPSVCRSAISSLSIGMTSTVPVPSPK